MLKVNRWFRVGLLFVLILMLSVWVEQVQSQQKYPTRAIDIIVPHGAGGATDLSTRITASYLAKKWSLPLNAINKPGGNFVPGTLEVYQATPDGYTMLAEAPGSTTTLEFAVKDPPFRVMDRTFVSMSSFSPHVLTVPANSPNKKLEDLIAEIKRDPENFRWGNMTGASPTETGMRQFFKAIGVDISKTKPVGTPSSVTLMTLVASGSVKVGFVSVNTSLPSIKGGMVRGLLMASNNRNAHLPDIPTASELGYPTVNVVTWVGYSGPPKLPSYIVEIWNKALQETLKDPEVISKFRNLGQEVNYLNASEFKERVKKEIEELKELYGMK